MGYQDFCKLPAITEITTNNLKINICHNTCFKWLISVFFLLFIIIQECIHSLSILPKCNDVPNAKSNCRLAWQPKIGELLAIPVDNVIEVCIDNALVAIQLSSAACIHKKEAIDDIHFLAKFYHSFLSVLLGKILEI